MHLGLIGLGGMFAGKVLSAMRLGFGEHQEVNG
jgi:6-phosphogluconate dehydrogenase (decarboxylating)